MASKKKKEEDLVMQLENLQQKYSLLLNMYDQNCQPQKSVPEINGLEWLLKPKLKNGSDYKPVYGDITQLNTNGVILGALGRDNLENIVSDFMDLLGTSSAVYEKNGDYAMGIFSSGWCQFMDQASFNCCGTKNLTKALKSKEWHCHVSCWKASLKAIETCAPVDMECSGGIRLYAIPVCTDKGVIGAINFGYGNPPQDKEKLRELAEKYKVEVSELEYLSREYSKRPQFIIDIAKKRIEGAAKIISHIVQRKLAEKELIEAKIKAEQSETKYRALYNNAPLSYQSLDENGCFVDVNPKWLITLGYLRSEVIGTWFGSYLHPDYLEHFKINFPAFLKRGYVTDVQFKLRRKNGSYIHVSFEGMVGYTADRKHKRTYCVFKDITEQKQFENELIKAKEKAEESDRLKTAFLQNMSHEIRTPLNAIHGFAGMLNKPGLSDEKRAGFISIIQNSGQQLLAIMDDILTISSIETKQERVNISSVCINDIIVELLSIFKIQATNKNISLYARQHLNDKQSEVFTDKTKVTQIMTNFLTNAIKFTHSGHIEFGYSLVDSRLEFFVRDTGIGIKPEMLERIFDRFTQADMSINRKYGGTGLGLSISKGFAELLGGHIWAKSEPEKGSAFYFSIPYNPVNSDEVREDESFNKKKPTILVAEDEEYNFLFIEELLNGMDVNLIHTVDGMETVEACRLNSNIDIILMDIKMPILDGFSAAKKIKKMRPDLPIIAQSAYALDHEVQRFKKTFDDYITKPLKEEILISKINNFLKNFTFNKQELEINVNGIRY